MIDLVGVGKALGGFAIPSLDLRIAPGKTTVLLGPSGSGKSTLLRLMVGLMRPDSGKVLFQGQELNAKTAPQLRRRIGFVVQEGGLFPHLSARENITLMAKRLHWDAARINARLAELLELTKLPREQLDRWPVQMSGGQRQRVSLMRALMMDPEVLLLDEPLGALDPLIRSELQTDLRIIFQRLQKTVILVTHDLGEAGYLGDELVLIRAGRIEQQSNFAQLVERPANEFVRSFISAQRPVSLWRDSLIQEVR